MMMWFIGYAFLCRYKYANLRHDHYYSACDNPYCEIFRFMIFMFYDKRGCNAIDHTAS